jgi:hypothetical protein
MAAVLELPSKGSPELSDAIEALIGPAVIERNIHQIGWWVTDAYLQGMRRFDIIDLDRGQLDVSYEEEDGDLHLRWEEPLTRIQTEIGRLSRLDTSPLVSKRANSLESLRASSIGQILLDQQQSLVDADAIDLGFFTGLVQYGTYGIASWRDETSDSPLASVRELIPPWELLFCPAGYSNPTDLRTVVRTRLFPLAQLIKLTGIRMPKDEALLDIVDLPHGANISQSVSGPGLGGGGTLAALFDEVPSDKKREGGATKRRKLQPSRDTEKFVRLREVFTLGPSGNTIARYVARAGRAIIMDNPYAEEDKVIPFPIGIGRYQSIGRAYGRSFAGKLVPFALEMEALLERLITNMADFDRFGFTLVPHDRGIDFENFKATEGPRIIGYEADITSPGSGVDQITPVSASDLPGRVFSMGMGVMDRTTAQGPMFGGMAPGRADSGEAFSVLAETGSTHLIPTAKSIKAAYATMYRFQLHEIQQRFQDTEQLSEGLPLTRIENSIAGVTIDAKTGRVKLEPDQLPDPFQVELSIRSTDPLAGERRRQEAPGLLSQGILPMLEFIILNYKEGWDYPIGNRAVWENYVKAVLLNLIMFNDGEKLGEMPGANTAAGIQGVYFHEAADKPEVHLLAIEDFIAGPEFALASVEVQNAFEERVSEIKSRLNMKIPDQFPSIDQAAAMSAAAREGQGGQGPQPAFG